MASSVFLNPSITEGSATQSVIPTVDNSFDLGSASFRWRSIYFGTSLIGTITGLGTTSTLAAVLQNTTAAAAGAQQISPGFDLVGQGWKTDATAASQEVRWRQEVLPVQGTSAPSSTWKLKASVNAGAFTEILTASASAVTSGVAFVFSGGSVLDGITAANTITQRNGTNPQLHDLYGTFTDASNYSRVRIGALTTSVYAVLGQSLGTGTLDEVRFGVGGGYGAWVASGAWVPDGANSRSLGTAAVPWGATYSAAYYRSGTLLISATAPTIASGFGTSPSIPTSNGTAAWTIDVGTGGSASSGVLTMPAATTGWVVDCVDITNAASFVTVQTAGTTTSVTLTNYSRTTGLAIAWTASDILRCKATAY